MKGDVRDHAAEAVETEFRLIDEWLSHGVSLRVVDAVVAVVAEEIARPLQARIEELEAALKLVDEAIRTGLGLSESLAKARTAIAKAKS